MEQKKAIIDDGILIIADTEETIDRRKVLITNGMSNDKMLIITDAPTEAMEKWCRAYNKGLEDGTSILFDPLSKAGYYVRILHDSETDDNEDIDIIGYDEAYDLFDYSD